MQLIKVKSKEIDFWFVKSMTKYSYQVSITSTSREDVEWFFGMLMKQIYGYIGWV